MSYSGLSGPIAPYTVMWKIQIERSHVSITTFHTSVSELNGKNESRLKLPE